MSQIDAAAPAPARQRHRWRSILSSVLIVLACILAPLTIATVWIADEIGDTDRYVATMAPLATDPAVQAGITNRVTNEVVKAVDVNGIVTDLTGALTSVAGDRPRLTGALDSLAAPIESGFAGFVHTAVAKVVQSPQFATVWKQVNRTAHATVVQALSGGKGIVNSSDKSVTVDVGPIVDKVKQQLVADGFKLASKIPAVHTTFTIADTGSLEKARKGFHLLDKIGNWMPFIVLALVAGGIALASNRRKTLIRAALGVFISTAILGITLWIFRHVYLNKLPATVSRDAAAAVYDTIIHFLRVAVRTVGTLTLVLAAAAYFTGPGRFAVYLRTLAKDLIGALRRVAGQVGFKDGGAGTWVHRFRTWIAWIAIGGAALWYILLANPTVGAVLWLTLGVLVVLFVLEFLDPSDGLAEGEAPAAVDGAGGPSGPAGPSGAPSGGATG